MGSFPLRCRKLVACRHHLIDCHRHVFHRAPAFRLNLRSDCSPEHWATRESTEQSPALTLVACARASGVYRRTRVAPPVVASASSNRARSIQLPIRMTRRRGQHGESGKTITVSDHRLHCGSLRPEFLAKRLHDGVYDIAPAEALAPNVSQQFVAGDNAPLRSSVSRGLGRTLRSRRR